MLNEKRVDYDLYTDEDLVIDFKNKASQNAVFEIIQRYKYLVRNISKSYFLPGADYEDLIQEAYLGLFKAVRDYRPQLDVSFRSFAGLCIKRQVITAIKQATRQKHFPLNRALSLYKPLFEDIDSGNMLVDIVVAPVKDQPENSYILKETLQEVQQKVTMQLSTFEAEILELYIDGYTYAEMAALLKVHEKAITNGMYRIKKKLKQLKQQMKLE